MKKKYDFSGWATRFNIKCTDGRTIRKDAFKHNDGQTVPLVWNHRHDDPGNILGHALLENRDEGVYAYCTFNNTEAGKAAKELVRHGDIEALSIYANQLKQKGGDVMHGMIRELSLVLAGANIGAYIDSVMAHGEESEEEATIYTEVQEFVLSHSDEEDDKTNEEQEDLTHSEDPKDKQEQKEDTKVPNEKTVQEVIDSMSEEQKNVMYFMIGQAMEDQEGDDEEMKQNAFDNDTQETSNFLSHADQEEIIALAKKPGYTFQSALETYMEENDMELAHGFTEEALEQLFPEHKLLNPGAPEQIDDDYDWCDQVLAGVHKSPISRVRTRHVDMRATKDTIRAMGYEKGTEKKLIGQLSLLNRSCDPQTVYIKEKLERDDIIDVTDFDYVNYMKSIMRKKLNREIATAILVGDGRAEGEEGKIKEAHIRSIWHDEELYTMHVDVDFAKFKAELQGTDTSKHFGENYIIAEALIQTALYSREKYRGTGLPTFFCPEHTLNVMLLARDLNGRRIFNSKADLTAQLNVKRIISVNQFEGLKRTDSEAKEHKLLGLFVNLSDYQVGSTKGGEITNFEDFDIDFNQYKYLMETRLSGSLTAPFSAIALEEPVASTEA